MKPLFIGLMVASFWWWRSDPDVEKGNAKVAEGKFEEALADFERADQRLSDEEQERVLAFDRGVALHGAGKAEDARKAFAAAAQSGDAMLRSRAAFNEGNTANALSDKQGAVDAYVRSLRADPTFEPAKRNLEILLTREDPPDPDGGGEGGDGGGGDGGSDGGGGGGQGDGGQDGGGQGDGGQDGGGGGGSDGGPSQDGGDPNAPPPMDQPQVEQPKPVNEQDAMRLLDAMREAEKHRPLGRIMLKDTRPRRSTKDW